MKKLFASAFAAALSLAPVMAGAAEFSAELDGKPAASAIGDSDKLYIFQGGADKSAAGSLFLRPGNAATCGSGEVSKHTGAGVFTCVTPAGGGTPAGSSGDWQKNSAGSFGGFTPGAGIETWVVTPSGENLASALTTALPASKGGTGLTALGAGVALFLGTPSGTNLASALTTALPDSKGGTGLTALGTGVATFLGTPSGTNLASALTTALPVSKGGTGLTSLGTGVATFLGTPAGAAPLTWLASQGSCTIVANATGGGAVPTAVTLGSGLACSGGQIIVSALPGSLTVGDGVNEVIGTTSLIVDPKAMVIGGSAGAATLSPTATVGTDRSAADYTIDAADSSTVIPVGVFTYTLAQAGSTGFEAGWGTCVHNVAASGNATVTTTTSVFKGAGGASSLMLAAGDWACFASAGGNWDTMVGRYNTLPGALFLSGQVLDTIGSDQNNYNPTGLSTTTTLMINGGGSGRNITGLVPGAPGHLLAVMNNGATNTITLVNESASSTAANRITLGGNVELAVGASALLRYDTATSRWRPFGRALSSTGVTAGAYTCSNITVSADGRLTAAANGSCGAGTAISLPAAGWVATSKVDGVVVFTATRAMTVSAIRGTVATPVGATATITVKKAASGTACSASGTAQHSGTFNANGTANTAQTLTLVGGGDNVLAAGDQICLSSPNDGAFTAGVGIGTITVEVTM